MKEILSKLEVAANTVIGCYARNPDNFARALQMLEEATKEAREIMERSTASGKAKEKLTLGNLSDQELAGELHNALLNSAPTLYSKFGLVHAASERIRWLSEKLENTNGNV